MKTKLLLLAILFSVQLVAQAPAIEWDRSYGGTGVDNPGSIQQTTDGGYIVAGSSNSNNGDVTGNHGMYDCWIIKLDTSGNLVWQKSFGGAADDRANSIDQTTDGGYIVAGYTSSNDGDVSGNHGQKDYWIVKLDDTGNLVWQKTFGGSADDYASSIEQTSDGGYIVAGSSNSNNGDLTTNNGQSDYWIVKLDVTGNLVWQKSFGNSSDNIAKSIQPTSDGGYIMTGSFRYGGNPSNPFGYTYSDILKLDANGNIVWSTAKEISANCIIETTDTGIVVTGSKGSAYAGDDFIGQPTTVIKFDANGNTIWESAFGSFYSYYSYSTLSVRQTLDGGYILAGFTSTGYSYYKILKLDASGNLVWQKSGESNTVGLDIEQTLDEGFVLLCTVGYNFKIVKFGPETLSASEFQSDNQSMIYPNPTQETINLKVIDQYQSLSINDISGKQLFQTNEKTESLSLANYQKGIYFLTMQFENGKSETHKIIKN